MRIMERNWRGAVQSHVARLNERRGKIRGVVGWWPSRPGGEPCQPRATADRMRTEATLYEAPGDYRAGGTGLARVGDEYRGG